MRRTPKPHMPLLAHPTWQKLQLHIRDGPLFFWRGGGGGGGGGGGDEKSLSANFFFSYAPLQTIFF